MLKLQQSSKSSIHSNKANYRPVSILPTISKLYERVLSDQMPDHCDGIMSKYLCAFRKCHGCHTVLLKLVEDWKATLDQKKIIGAILMNLSRAFDCLPHRFLIAKLNAYGLDDTACTLLSSYLQHRHQRVKLGMSKSNCGLRF